MAIVMTFGDHYFSFDGSFSLPIFYVLPKNKENLLSRSFNFLQNTLVLSHCSQWEKGRALLIGSFSPIKSNLCLTLKIEM